MDGNEIELDRAEDIDALLFGTSRPQPDGSGRPWKTSTKRPLRPFNRPGKWRHGGRPASRSGRCRRNLNRPLAPAAGPSCWPAHGILDSYLRIKVLECRLLNEEEVEWMVDGLVGHRHVVGAFCQLADTLNRRSQPADRDHLDFLGYLGAAVFLRLRNDGRNHLACALLFQMDSYGLCPLDAVDRGPAAQVGRAQGGRAQVGRPQPVPFICSVVDVFVALGQLHNGFGFWLKFRRSPRYAEGGWRTGQLLELVLTTQAGLFVSLTDSRNFAEALVVFGDLLSGFDEHKSVLGLSRYWRCVNLSDLYDLFLLTTSCSAGILFALRVFDQCLPVLTRAGHSVHPSTYRALCIGLCRREYHCAASKVFAIAVEAGVYGQDRPTFGRPKLFSVNRFLHVREMAFLLERFLSKLASFLRRQLATSDLSEADFQIQVVVKSGPEPSGQVVRRCSVIRELVVATTTGSQRLAQAASLLKPCPVELSPIGDGLFSIERASLSLYFGELNYDDLAARCWPMTETERGRALLEPAGLAGPASCQQRMANTNLARRSVSLEDSERKFVVIDDSEDDCAVNE